MEPPTIGVARHSGNLDPTRRTGVEGTATVRVHQSVRLRGGFAHTQAVFQDGPFAGNVVPLVSRWTGHAGASWEIRGPALMLDAVARYYSSRQMDNDRENVQPLIPDFAVADLRIGGAIENFRWSVAVLNVFDKKYFEYAVASAFTLGTYNAYPLPGRTFLARGSVTF